MSDNNQDNHEEHPSSADALTPGMTTKSGGKHPSTSASKSTSRPHNKSLDEYPANHPNSGISGSGKSQNSKAGHSGGASGRS